MLEIKNQSGAPGILSNFDRCRLLVVENGFFLDGATNRMLAALGARVERTDGEIPSPSRALNPCDAAIIDISLSSEETFAWAEKLHELGIPYIFATNLEKNSGDQHLRPFRLCADMAELQSIAAALFDGERFN